VRFEDVRFYAQDGRSSAVLVEDPLWTLASGMNDQAHPLQVRHGLLMA
jgi:hypothetical protein